MSVLAAAPDASALKGDGTSTKKFGSKTKSVICGDKLCSEVRKNAASQQSRFQVGGVMQQSASGLDGELSKLAKTCDEEIKSLVKKGAKAQTILDAEKKCLEKKYALVKKAADGAKSPEQKKKIVESGLKLIQKECEDTIKHLSKIKGSEKIISELKSLCTDVAKKLKSLITVIPPKETTPKVGPVSSSSDANAGAPVFVGLPRPTSIPCGTSSHPNLYVSAENTAFQNYFVGPQVIEVVVCDSDISDTSSTKGEPDVTINGKKLRMVQAIDGFWYGYFADYAQAKLADGLYGGGYGLDFGVFCGPQTDSSVFGARFTETAAFTVSRNFTGLYGYYHGDSSSQQNACTKLGNLTPTKLLNHVVRESNAVNPGSATVQSGQIGLNKDAWPVIQLYNFNPTGNAVVQYNKGGGVQSTTLSFDTVDQFATSSLDKASYGDQDDVGVFVSDIQLNIDPTDEDSWSWGAQYSPAITHYQDFDEQGNVDADGKTYTLDHSTVQRSATVDLTPHLSSLMFGNNGILTINNDGKQFIRNNDNDLEVLAYTNNIQSLNRKTMSISEYKIPVTITESHVNSGIFSNIDAQPEANLVVSVNSTCGVPTINYNNKQNQVIRSGASGPTSSTLSWSQQSYSEFGTGILTINDADRNLDGDVVDIFYVTVWSDSDAGGTEMAMIETGSNTGVFVGEVIFTSTGMSQLNPTQLRVAPTDTVTARYADYTGPTYCNPGPTDIVVTTLIDPASQNTSGNSIPACPSSSGLAFTICNVHYEDSSGNTITNAMTGDRVFLVTTVQHHSTVAEDFVLQMYLDSGARGSSNQPTNDGLKYVVGKASASRIFTVKEPYEFDTPATYTGYILMWPHFNTQTPIANGHPVSSITIGGQSTTPKDLSLLIKVQPMGFIISQFESSIPGCEQTNSCYLPYTHTVNVGDTVNWYNGDQSVHTFTSANVDFTTSPPSPTPDGIFDSGLVEPGHTFSYTYNTAGTHHYFCMVHPWMIGKIIVN